MVKVAAGSASSRSPSVHRGGELRRGGAARLRQRACGAVPPRPARLVSRASSVGRALVVLFEVLEPGPGLDRVVDDVAERGPVLALQLGEQRPACLHRLQPFRVDDDRLLRRPHVVRGLLHLGLQQPQPLRERVERRPAVEGGDRGADRVLARTFERGVRGRRALRDGPRRRRATPSPRGDARPRRRRRCRPRRSLRPGTAAGRSRGRASVRRRPAPRVPRRPRVRSRARPATPRARSGPWAPANRSRSARCSTGASSDWCAC